MWAKITAAVVSFLNKLALPFILAITFMRGVAAGRDKSELERLREERDRIEAAKEARREAENSDKPDPYWRND